MTSTADTTNDGTGDIVRVHEQMLTSEERGWVDYLTTPVTSQGPGYMRPCMLQIVHEARQTGDSAEINALLECAQQHQDQHECGGHVAPPRELICPLTLDIMDDPCSLVYATPGGNGLHTFERAAIEQWLNQNETNPINRQPANASDLISNTSIRAAIATWRTTTHISGLQFNVCDDH